MGIPIVGGPWNGGLYFGGSPLDLCYPVKKLAGGEYWIVEIVDGAIMKWVPKEMM